MSMANQRNRRSGILMAGHGVRFLLIMALNFLPVLLVPRLDKVLPSDSADLLKTVLLQALEDIQECLFSLQEPMLSEFVSNILSKHPDSDTRDLISKSDSLSAVFKMWMVKIPTIIITVTSTLPKTRYSLLAIPAVGVIWAIWYFLFSPVVQEVQRSKLRRDKAIKAGHMDEHTQRQGYVRAQSRLAGKLGLWRALRITCCALLIYGNRRLDKTLMSRLSHQLASLETILMKETQNRIRTGKIVCAAFWQMKLGRDDMPGCTGTETPQGQDASTKASLEGAVGRAMISRNTGSRLRILWDHLTAACCSSSMQPSGKLQGNRCRDPARPVQEDPAPTEGSRLISPKTSFHYGVVEVCKAPQDPAVGVKEQVSSCLGRHFDHQRPHDGVYSGSLCMV